MPRLVTVGEFAKLIGISSQAVTYAISSGRIEAKVAENGWKQIDPIAAAEQWIRTCKRPDHRTAGVQAFLKRARENPEEFDKPRSVLPNGGKRMNPIPGQTPPSMDILESNALKAEYAAKREQLRFEKEAGKLVEVDIVIRKMTSLAATVRTKMLAIPSRAKLKLQQLTMEDIEVLEVLVREALDELTNINMEELDDGDNDGNGEAAD